MRIPLGMARRCLSTDKTLTRYVTIKVNISLSAILICGPTDRIVDRLLAIAGERNTAFHFGVQRLYKRFLRDSTRVYPKVSGLSR